MRTRTAALLVALATVPFALGAAELPGTWSAQVNGTEYDLTFDSNGGLSVVEANDAIAVAQYEADDGELTITDLGGAKACQGEQAEATYRYELSGGRLSLTSVEDACESRAAILDGTTFQAADSG